jgi:hypothetical protein
MRSAVWEPERNRHAVHLEGETPYPHSKAQLRFRTVDPVSLVSASIGLRGVQHPCHDGHESSNGLHEQRRIVLSPWRADTVPEHGRPASRANQPAWADEAPS